jgi:hypothetical protein
LATICSLHGHAVDNRPSPPQKRFTLKERLFPQRYLGSTYHCIANLKQIDGAIQQWALVNKKTDGDKPPPGGFAVWLKGGEIAPCPEGGKYAFTYVSNAPVCTRAISLGHSLP